MMKNLFVFFGVFVFVSRVAYAEAPFEINFKSHVLDVAGALATDENLKLNGILAEIEFATTCQIVVAIIQTLAGKKIEGFSLALANDQGIGQKFKNNGVLILLAVKEREGRIEVGYGLETVLTDPKATLILHEKMIPFFKNAHYGEGLMSGVAAIKALLYEQDVKEFFSMQWNVKNFESFIEKYPDSALRCDATLNLARFNEDHWSGSYVKMFNDAKRRQAVFYYQKYLDVCIHGIWKENAKRELEKVKNSTVDDRRYLP